MRVVYALQAADAIQYLERSLHGKILQVRAVHAIPCASTEGGGMSIKSGFWWYRDGDELTIVAISDGPDQFVDVFGIDAAVALADLTGDLIAPVETPDDVRKRYEALVASA